MLFVHRPRIYDSEFHLDIGWLWDGGINIDLNNGAVTGHVNTVAEILPWLQKAIAEYAPQSQFNRNRLLEE
jgi:hypothetical protein